jgi:hypothetical protein
MTKGMGVRPSSEHPIQRHRYHTRSGSPIKHGTAARYSRNRKDLPTIKLIIEVPKHRKADHHARHRSEEHPHMPSRRFVGVGIGEDVPKYVQVGEEDGVEVEDSGGGYEAHEGLHVACPDAIVDKRAMTTPGSKLNIY